MSPAMTRLHRDLIVRTHQPLPLHPDFFSRLPRGRHCSALSDACLFDLLPIPTLRGAGGGDGEPRDGEPARETEASAQAPRALPVPPARVFTRHTHQVRLHSLSKSSFPFVSSFQGFTSISKGLALVLDLFLLMGKQLVNFHQLLIDISQLFFAVCKPKIQTSSTSL